MKQKPKIHQLSDFQIDEVSLVDHAANKRRFVILKRESTMPEDTDSQASDDQEDVAAPTNEKPETPAAAASGDQTPLLDMLQQIKAVVSDLAARASAPIAANEDTEVVKSLKSRVEVLEKSFGLPASQTDDGTRNTPNAHSWPFDINEKRGA